MIDRIRNVRNRIAMFKNWQKTVFPFNRFFKGVQRLRLRNGKSAYVHEIRSMDLNIVRDVLWRNEYELDALDLPEDPVVVDLGANIGTFCIEAKHRFPAARIVAYEPHPENFKLLQMNAPFATLVQKAATGEAGTVHFEDSENYVGLKVVEQGGILVQSAALEDIVRDFERIDLLKIDIEGSELGLLRSIGPAAFSKVRNILMELHETAGTDVFNWAETLLAGHGFTPSWIEPSTGPFRIIRGKKA